MPTNASKDRQPLVLHKNGYLRSNTQLYEIVEVQNTGARLRNVMTEFVQFWPNDWLSALHEVIPAIPDDADSLSCDGR